MFKSYNMGHIFLVCHILLLFPRLKAREVSRKNMRNSENTGHIILGIV